MRLPVKWFMVALVVVAWQIANCQAAIYVFGDSLSETGNFYVATGGAFPPSPLYFEGRFSNGRAWVEHFASVTGEPIPTPSFLGGTNFAVNGSRAAGVSPYGTPDLTEQVSSFLLASGGTANSEDIFVVWAGANDIFFGASAGETNFIPNAIEAIGSSVAALYAAGARNIVILDLPPLGQTPFFIGTMSSKQLNAATNAFNSALSSLIRGLRHQLPKMKMVDVKISRLFQSIAQSPQLYGLQNTRDSATLFDPVTGIGYALSPGVIADRYLFWDSVHPSARGHKIIALYVWLEFKLQCLGR
ncbi:MAG: SGNH/GDSL hydrolase family protein [Pirellulaceae bacterium]|nr:SGNH/GDSL hydrolase family protein [Pirellulaceae bacterium]